MNIYKVDSPYLGNYYCNELDMYKVMGIALHLTKEDAVNLVLEATNLVTDAGTKYHYVPVDKDYVLSLLGRESHICTSTNSTSTIKCTATTVTD